MLRLRRGDGGGGAVLLSGEFSESSGIRTVARWDGGGDSDAIPRFLSARYTQRRLEKRRETWSVRRRSCRDEVAVRMFVEAGAGESIRRRSVCSKSTEREENQSYPG